MYLIKKKIATKLLVEVLNDKLHCCAEMVMVFPQCTTT